METIAEWINATWPTVGAVLLAGSCVGLYYAVRDLVIGAWKDLER